MTAGRGVPRAMRPEKPNKHRMAGVVRMAPPMPNKPERKPAARLISPAARYIE